MRRALGCIALLWVAVMLAACAGNWYRKYGIQEKNMLQSPESIPGLIKALDDPEPKIRLTSMRILARFYGRASDALPKIKQMAQADPDDGVREYAKRVIPFIARMEHPEPIPQRIEAAAFDSPIDVNLVIAPKMDLYNGYKQDAIVRRTGILPFDLVIENRSDHPIAPIIVTVELMDDQGINYKQLDTETVVNRSKFSIGATIWKSAVANGKIKNFYADNTFKSGPIPPGTTGRGMIYFEVGRRFNTLEGWKMKIPIESQGKPYVIRSDFSDRFTVSPAEPPPVAVTQPPPPPIPSSEKPAGSGDLESKLTALKNLLDKGLITEDDYNRKKNELLTDY